MNIDDKNVIKFTLEELLCMCSLISMFDHKLSCRLFDIYNYHKTVLKENYNQPLQITIKEIQNYKRKFIFKKCYQPEFIFSDDEDKF